MVTERIARTANCIPNNATVREDLYSLSCFITQSTGAAGNFPVGPVQFARRLSAVTIEVYRKVDGDVTPDMTRAP